jgi:hypothetical protein
MIGSAMSEKTPTTTPERAPEPKPSPPPKLTHAEYMAACEAAGFEVIEPATRRDALMKALAANPRFKVIEPSGRGFVIGAAQRPKG